jgi:hypothetical protein
MNSVMPSPSLAHSRAAQVSPGVDRRMRGRVRQQGVVSNLGVVLDLSAGGMRILSTKSLEGEMDVQIWTESDSIALKAATVWSKRVGFRRHVIGFQFVDLDERATTKLCQIAASHRLRVP